MAQRRATGLFPFAVLNCRNPLPNTIRHSLHTLLPISREHVQRSHRISPQLIHLSYRYKRGAKGRKQAKEQEFVEKGRPEKGTTLDTEDYRKRMQKHILKLQQSLREVQPKTANTSK